MPEVQQLCALNLQLREREARLAAIRRVPLPGPQMVMVSPELTEIGALSWLWVLGAYEVFRRAKNCGGGLVRDPTFQSLNGEISEIRMVLAKQEARFRSDLKQVPKILQSRDGAFGWGYWDRSLKERQFFRAQFAETWIAAAGDLYCLAV